MGAEETGAAGRVGRPVCREPALILAPPHDLATPTGGRDKPPPLLSWWLRLRLPEAVGALLGFLSG